MKRMLVAVVLATLLISSCATRTTGPEPIRIGSLLSRQLDFYNWLAGMQAAARGINARGGINGRPVVIDNCDDGFDANQALACAHRLVQDGVIATAGDFTEFGQVEAPILDAAGIPEVGPFVFSPEEGSLPTSFPWRGGNTNLLAGLIMGMKQRGLHTMYMAVWDVPGERALVPLATQVAKMAGITIIGQELIPDVVSDANDFQPYVTAAMQAQPDVFYAAMPPAAQIPFLQEARVEHAQFLDAVPGGELAPEETDKIGGTTSLTENEIGFAWAPPPSATAEFPALRTFKADMDAEQEAGNVWAVPAERSADVVEEWLSVEMIVGLVRKLHVVTAATLLQALRTSTTIDTLGLTGAPWHPNQPAPFVGGRPLPRTLISSGFLITQHGGQAVLADPAPFNLYQALGFPG